MTVGDESVDTSSAAITREALRRATLMEAGDYEQVERMRPSDLWIGIVIFVVSMTAMYAGIWF